MFWVNALILNRKNRAQEENSSIKSNCGSVLFTTNMEEQGCPTRRIGMICMYENQRDQRAVGVSLVSEWLTYDHWSTTLNSSLISHGSHQQSLTRAHAVLVAKEDGRVRRERTSHHHPETSAEDADAVLAKTANGAVHHAAVPRPLRVVRLQTRLDHIQWHDHTPGHRACNKIWENCWIHSIWQGAKFKINVCILVNFSNTFLPLYALRVIFWKLW